MSDTPRHPKHNSGSFKPGVSGNPNGSPHDKQVSALARRYTVDAITALVGVARKWSTDPAPAVTAARALLDVGYPGMGKGAGAAVEQNVLHLHLLAVQRVQPVENPHLTHEPALEAPEAPEIEGEALFFDPQALPEPEEDLPGDALPLWDEWKRRKARQNAQETSDSAESTSDSRTEAGLTGDEPGHAPDPSEGGTP
jgi:hypothetical protein